MTATALLLLAVAAFGTWVTNARQQYDVRDGWLKALGYGAGTVIFVLEPGLGLFFLAAVFRWQGHEGLPDLITWIAVAVVYFGAKHVSRLEGGVIVAGFCVVCLVNIAGAAYAAVRVRMVGMTMHEGRDKIYGFLGSRLILGLWSVVGLVLTPWPLTMPAFVLGALLSTSWVVLMFAMPAAVLWRWPTWEMALVIALAAVPGAWLFLHRYRGTMGDGLRIRALLWELMLRVWLGGDSERLVFGVGRGAFKNRFARWWQIRGYTEHHWQQAHNDLIHLVFERGLYGVVAAALWLWSLSTHMTLGDGLSAALVAFLVMSLSYFPFFLPQAATVAVLLAGLLAGR